MHLKKRLESALKAFGDPSSVMPQQQLVDMIDDRLRVALADIEAQTEAALEAARQVTASDTALARDGEAWTQAAPRWDRVRDLARGALSQAGLSCGTMLEIGGRLNPRNADFPEFTYQALDFEDAPGAGVEVTAGDITNCPQIPDESYDFIFSFDVFEHIDKPWLAASEIIRLLRPGGVTMHSTLFSWRYHPCPIDYWRYSAEGLKSLFEGLDCLHSDFDYAERRRDIRGRNRNAVTPDAFGGWRENVRVNYAGMKPR
ncbi:class I SAM-dependent methyltransferase [Roseovarius sp. EGI FJ00037]|uniref:class I SAM-dependent methyltransferase n=1 Tax=Roseovarius TaxID=74030 RepID=UPI0022A7800E|nr:class I SAM-dependent methyltransferase [Roseovarius sp. EGI FJ00037]MCZ0811355.1 class I SAM-dependent methyltransferase [Roseovarius sp. EGI FJ00037]